MNSESRVPEQGAPDTPLGAIPFLFLPRRDLFARRAERLRELSPGHSLEGYLRFLALIADCQQRALDRMPEHPPFGKAAEAAGSVDPRRASLATRPRDPSWREGLALVLEGLRAAPLPDAARLAISGLLAADPALWEKGADRILAGQWEEVPAAEYPLLGAGLQLHWVRLALALEDPPSLRLGETTACPVCGSPPAAGVVRACGAERGLRYLCCALCGSQWYLERIKCGGCTATGAIDYFALEGSDGAVKAESCGECGGYLKLLYLEKESRMDPLADDLASLGLDLLMERQGRGRLGANLLFHPGRI